MSDLKPGYVRVFQCEACGLVVTPSHLERMCDVHFLPSTEEEWGAPCHGEFVERILADPDVVREECAKMVIDMAGIDPDGYPSSEYDGTLLAIAYEIRALADAPRETESDGGGAA